LEVTQARLVEVLIISRLTEVKSKWKDKVVVK
jgi:hypothetical protein